MCTYASVVLVELFIVVDELAEIPRDNVRAYKGNKPSANYLPHVHTHMSMIKVIIQAQPIWKRLASYLSHVHTHPYVYDISYAYIYTLSYLHAHPYMALTSRGDNVPLGEIFRARGGARVELGRRETNFI